MRNTYVNAATVLLVLLLAAFFVYPPERNLRLGRDLAGGVSLVYAVDIRPDDPPGTLGNVITVLKDRLDPTGQLEIGIVAQGNERIEITMPLPSERVKNLRAEFEATLTGLERDYMTPDEFELLMNAPPEQRSARIEQIGQGDAGRAEMLRAAAQAFDRTRQTSGELGQAREILREREAEAVRQEEANAGEMARFARLRATEAMERVNTLELAAANAIIAYEEAREQALDVAISPGEMRRVLRLSNEPIRLRDERTNVVETLPSPRQQALTRLRTAHPGSEPQIERVLAAWERYTAERRTLDDPADLKRMLRGAGVLEFRITVDPGALANEAELRARIAEVGPRNAGNETAGWYRLNRLESWYDSGEQLRALTANPQAYFRGRGYVVEPFDGEFFMLAYRTPGARLTQAEGDWRVEAAYESRDQRGLPAISFQMDPIGARRLGQLTENNINNRMAVLLDDEVYTAPNINSRISRDGQITGQFPAAEIQYITRVLAAGSLQAKLSPEPISESVLGPALGLDNLRRGLNAAILSFLVVAVFMVGYYFFCGWISVVALLANGLLLLGAMAAQGAAFTLPGIAGVALTFGIAVDANVLIYERMREELRKGADAKTAVRLGYQRALSSIVDGNLTNLIICVVLGFMGTQEIRGFAITLGIGVVTTLFTQLFMTRVLFSVFVQDFGLRRLRMLPLIFPGIDRALSPRIDWIGLRWFFVAFSILIVGLGVGMIAYRGADLLDSEFRGGTSVTIQLRTGEDGRPITQQRGEIEGMIVAYARQHPDIAVQQLRDVDIVVVNPQGDGVTSSTFTIKTAVQDADLVQRAVGEAFGNLIERQERLEFAGADATALGQAPVYPILRTALGDSIGRTEVRNDVGEFVGGVAIVLENLTPAPTLASLEARLNQVRTQPDFAAAIARQVRIIPIDGSADAVRSAVIVVRDQATSFFADESAWRQFAQEEWNLTRTAFTESTTLASVQSFSASIAQTFRAQAIISTSLATLLIVIYVWVRFNSFRYSIAAVVATIHDSFVAVGIVALAGLIYEMYPEVGGQLGLLPFKFDLALVAAVMTILGYSINDTIIVMDRIRELRGKLPYASRDTINQAINQTISRTVITSGTTLISVFILYMLGGAAVREFAFALLVGIIAGTYSSFGVAAPMVWVKGDDKAGGTTGSGVDPLTGRPRAALP